MRRSRFLSLNRGWSGLAGAALLCLLASGCASTGTGTDPAGASHAAGDRISILASTNVYGDIAASIGGDAVEVTSLITSPAQDPHSYEASARDTLAVSQADLVIVNGGGYDSFMPALLDGTGKDPAAVISAVDLSGLEAGGAEASGHAHEEGAADHGHGGFNEHVWYDLATAGKVADAVANKLAQLDTRRKSVFEGNAAAFRRQLAGLEADRAALAKQLSGQAVAATDPVPLYLLEELGLENLTPEDFLEAAEEGSDAAPAALQQTKDLAASKSVRFVAYNAQTEGPQTRQVRAAAENAGTPVLNFTETLPEGEHYADWMKMNLQNIATAAGSSK
jgi:zinc/manganese transport system substrate-binding protein